MKYFATIFLVVSCSTNYQQIIKGAEVKKIQIEGSTIGQKVSDKISVTDRIQIDLIVGEINRMNLLDSTVDVKDNFGEYDLKIELKDGSIKNFLIIYTTYNGVIILGSNSWGTFMNKYYKNDRLELLVLRLLQPR